MSNLPTPVNGGIAECPRCGLRAVPERIERHDCTPTYTHSGCDLTHILGHENSRTEVYTRDTNAGPHREIRCGECGRSIEIIPIRYNLEDL